LKAAAFATGHAHLAEHWAIQAATIGPVSVPLDWCPKLRGGSADARRNWRLIGRWVGILGWLYRDGWETSY
jgi:hypothetical protein